MSTKIFTKKEYVPGYQGLNSYYVTYDLKNMQIIIGSRIKKMSDYFYKKAMKYIENGEV